MIILAQKRAGKLRKWVSNPANRLRHEADHSTPTSVEVKNERI
jgi:hypothetical protein